MLRIIKPQTKDDFDAIRQLCWAYREFLGSLKSAESRVVAKYYPEDAYQELMNQIEVLHAPPGGGLRLALLEDTPIGCGMFHTLSPGVLEIKRVFLTPDARGSGAGRKIVEVLIEDCRAAGAHKINLDTGRNLSSAIQLYESLGFKQCEPYQDVPKFARDVMLFFELDL